MKIDVKEIKGKFPKGTRIVLLEDMVEEPGMLANMTGTVDYVDDIGSIHMHWDNGRTLAIILDIDEFKIIERVDNSDVAYNFKIETINEKVARAEPKLMQINLGMFFKIIAEEVVDNTPGFNYKEDYIGTATKQKLENQLLNECKVYDLGKGRLYCSNEDLGRPYKTLDYDDAFECSETFMFTRKSKKLWVVESLKCVEEGKMLFFQRHLDKFYPEPYEMVLIMKKCKLEQVYVSNEK